MHALLVAFFLSRIKARHRVALHTDNASLSGELHVLAAIEELCSRLVSWHGIA